MRPVPSHTPLLLVETQLPLNAYDSFAQRIQSFDVAPLQVEHAEEQLAQAVPLLLKLPSGHTVPDDVLDSTASHFVLSFASCVKPVLQARQVPVESAHDVQPNSQTINRVRIHLRDEKRLISHLCNHQQTSNRILQSTLHMPSHCLPWSSRCYTNIGHLIHIRRLNNCKFLARW